MSAPVRSLRATVLWLLLAGTALLPVCAGSLLREVYQGIGGNTVAELTNSTIYPGKPTFTNFVTDLFESPTGFDENYGQRMHGYLTPPVTGNYTFWMASDDNGSLYLSTDETPVNQRLICFQPDWAGVREWSKYPEQQSAPIALQAGKSYYIIALQKEGGGGDNLAVRWLRPDGVDEGPIPATYLLPWGTSFTPPQITQQPTNTMVVEGDLATFVVKLQNLDLVTAQWRRNSSVIAGATGTILTYGPAVLADSGATFSATLTNKLGSATTTSATLTVTPDTTKPTLVSGVNLGPTTIQLVFSEALSAATATVPGNYTVTGGVTVTGAAFGADPRRVLLTTTPVTFGTTYTVKVRSVQDRAQTPNTIVADSPLTFLALEFVSQDIGTTGGSIQRIGPGAYDVSGKGADIGGSADQLQFAWELRTGNFDLQVRVADAPRPRASAPMGNTPTARNPTGTSPAETPPNARPPTAEGPIATSPRAESPTAIQPRAGRRRPPSSITSKATCTTGAPNNRHSDRYSNASGAGEDGSPCEASAGAAAVGRAVDPSTGWPRSKETLCTSRSRCFSNGGLIASSQWVLLR